MIASDWPQLDGIPECLRMWVVTHCPLDFPGLFVVRRFFCMPWQEGMPCAKNGDGLAFDVVPRLATTLAEARALVPEGLYRQPRQDGEDPAVVECWF